MPQRKTSISGHSRPNRSRLDDRPEVYPELFPEVAAQRPANQRQKMPGIILKLTGFKVLAFDCYRTLIDWERGIVTGLAPLTDRLEREFLRNEILEAHARHESNQQRQTPTKRYQELLAIVYRRLAAKWGLIVSWDECLDYGRSVKKLAGISRLAGVAPVIQATLSPRDFVKCRQREFRCEQQEARGWF